VGETEVGGGELPAFVKDELDAYFRCGILAHGFLRVRCKDCGHSRVVAWSCKRRGFCPSCAGRRMADTAAFCVDHLFPKVPIRQYVLTVPVHFRFRMAYSPALTSAVLRCFIAAITSDLLRRARKRKLRGGLQTGALTVIQRLGSALGLNVHFHSLVLGGVYARQPRAFRFRHRARKEERTRPHRRGSRSDAESSRVLGWPSCNIATHAEESA
jgi:hypothetical protein